MKTLNPKFLLLVFALLSALCVDSDAVSAQSPAPNLMPLPAHMALGNGEFLVDGNFSVALQGFKDARLESARNRFVSALFSETGIPFRPSENTGSANFAIEVHSAASAVQQLEDDESYHLSVKPSQVHLTAANALGALHGLQTFLQLVHITAHGFVVPAVEIEDAPRFNWRGLMIDSGRHFIPLPVIERNLDGMEAVKLNVFHWHLSDDQGFRIESKAFPLLTDRGSNGEFYTQQQVKEVIQYAKDRGIRVVPEFDMPCHTTAWFAGYPELASGAGPYKAADKWGVLDPAMDPTRESTFQFLDRFIGEMTAIFPDSYFHIGGDECNGKAWDANPKIQTYMRTHGLKDNASLQSYFTGRIQKLVTAHGKITEGWDEVLQPNTPRDVVIQSWRGEKGLAASARQGNRVLLSNGYYIDLNQSAAQHYLTDPLDGEGASLTSEQKALVLGGEATMWSEFVTQENIDSRIWPRTAAIAERLWSPQKVRDVDSMYKRLEGISIWLQHCDLQHRSNRLMMLQRMTGEASPESLQVLASVVQPPEGYQREELAQYDTSSPLNKLVDAVPPESDTARQFAILVKQIVDGKASPEDWQQARSWLIEWRDNDAKLQPSLAGSEIAAELKSLSRDLSQSATIGLQALDDLQNHHEADANRVQASLQFLKASERPEAVLRDMVVQPVEQLVQATVSK